MKRWIYFTILLSICFKLSLKGVDFQHLTVDDGMSSGLVYSIAQDSVGFMWFATGNGLNRFSGNSFTIFPIYRDSHEDVGVGVEWINTVGKNEAVKEVGFFGNQNTVCKPTTQKWNHTVERLKKRWGIND